MNVEVSFRVERRILRCYVSGTRNPDHTQQYWQEMVNKCRKEKLNRMFVTMALQGVFDRFEAIEAYQSVINNLQLSNIAIAVTDLNEYSSAGCKMACHLAAAKNIRVVYVETETEANDWLNSQAFDSPEFDTAEPSTCWSRTP